VKAEIRLGERKAEAPPGKIRVAVAEGESRK
jgi:hypothetical protein